MRQPNQILLFSDQDIALIKSVFTDNEEGIYLIRKVLLQFELTVAEKKVVKAMMTPDLYAVLKKRIYPEVSPEFPLGQLSDIYQTVNASLQSRDFNEVGPLFEAVQLEKNYLEQQFAVLADPAAEEKIKLAELAKLEGKDAFQRYVDTTARNFLVGYIDQMLIFIRNIAGQKAESVEDAKKRMTRDSSK